MPTKSTHTQYTQEFKESSAKLAAESDQSIAKTAVDLGINKTTLYGWVKKYRPNRNEPSDNLATVNKELQQLRKENARLRQEREILKKAAACVPQAQQTLHGGNVNL